MSVVRTLEQFSFQAASKNVQWLGRLHCRWQTVPHTLHSQILVNNLKICIHRPCGGDPLRNFSTEKIMGYHNMLKKRDVFSRFDTHNAGKWQTDGWTKLLYHYRASALLCWRAIKIRHSHRPISLGLPLCQALSRNRSALLSRLWINAERSELQNTEHFLGCQESEHHERWRIWRHQLFRALRSHVADPTCRRIATCCIARSMHAIWRHSTHIEHYRNLRQQQTHSDVWLLRYLDGMRMAVWLCTKAQLSLRDRAMLLVIEYFAKLLKITKDHSIWHS